VRFNDGDSTLKNKPAPHSTFLTLKQKRYKRKKIIYPRYKYTRNDAGKLTKTPKYIGKPMLFKNELLLENDLNATKQYSMLKKKKKKYENSSVVLSRRILRTKRTLVLPAHVNLTAITNSYDVIHSWFIPGLGLKMDCIPGRSTHHTFYIDNVGFYYGQCAEVCGRFHHHMPIRICALPFEHFLI
jgi:heme/copper-type cytochrome/quinol oxidase subunit 2